MRLAATSLVAVSLLAAACRSSTHGVTAHGVKLEVPHGWTQLHPATDPVTEPHTLLAVGTGGVHQASSPCASAVYDSGATVSVVGWPSVASAGGVPPRGRAPLESLVAVRRNTLECFNGRAAAVDLLIAGKRYQVRVQVGDRASRRLVRQALAVARSFKPTR